MNDNSTVRGIMNRSVTEFQKWFLDFTRNIGLQSKLQGSLLIEIGIKPIVSAKGT